MSLLDALSSGVIRIDCQSPSQYASLVATVVANMDANKQFTQNPLTTRIDNKNRQQERDIWFLFVVANRAAIHRSRPVLGDQASLPWGQAKSRDTGAAVEPFGGDAGGSAAPNASETPPPLPANAGAADTSTPSANVDSRAATYSTATASGSGASMPPLTPALCGGIGRVTALCGLDSRSVVRGQLSIGWRRAEPGRMYISAAAPAGRKGWRSLVGSGLPNRRKLDGAPPAQPVGNPLPEVERPRGAECGRAFLPDPGAPFWTATSKLARE